MRPSKILAAIRHGRAAKLCMLGHFMPPFIAYAAHVGYDGVWLDLEHRAFDQREVQTFLAFCHLYDIDGLVRPASRDKAVLYRYLEDGAAGLVIPHVSNADEARDLVRMVKFPPLGDRGTNGKGLEANFGLSATRDQLVSHGLRETFLVVQMESPTSLANINEIMAVEGVDGVFGGGGDYVTRMQQQPTDQQVRYVEAMQQVADACKKYGKFWGTMAANESELRQWHTMGAKLHMWGVDVEIVQEALASFGEVLRRL